MKYRLGKETDLEEIARLIRDAIHQMRQKGIDQWDEMYPTAEDFANDIANETLYIVLDSDRIVALYVIAI